VVLRGYEVAGKQLLDSPSGRVPFAETFTFVLCGNFASVPHSANVSRSRVQLLFRGLAVSTAALAMSRP